MVRHVSATQKPVLNERLNVSLLGKCLVSIDSGERIVLPRKALLLLAFLIIDGRNGMVGRNIAAEFLWEDVDADRRDGNLRNLLYRVRLALAAREGLELFDITEREIMVSNWVGYVDVAAFRAILSGTFTQNILAVCEVYQGELLEGQTSNGEKLSHWLRDRRSGLQQAFVAIVAKHLEGGPTNALPPNAQVVARKLLQVEPTNEAAYRILMRLLAEKGDTKAITHLYRKIARLLERELQARPEQKTRDLYRQLVGAGVAEAVSQTLRHEKEFPAVAVINRYLPRVAIVAYRPIDASRLEAEIVASTVDRLLEQLCLSGGLLIQDSGIHGITDTLFRQNIFNADVDYIIEATYRYSEIAASISFRLVERITRNVLWVRACRILNRVAQNLREASYSLFQHIEAREIAKLSESAEYTNAYRLTLQGAKALQVLELPSIRRARGIMKSALTVDPDHVPALAGLARSYVLEGLLATRADKNLLEEAENHAKKIITLNSQNSRGYQELGVARLYGRRFEGATELLRTAKNLNPTGFDINVDLADALISIGNSGEALSILDELSAVASVSTDLEKWIAAGAHYSLENYREALRCIDSMKNPETVSRLSAASYAMLGEKEQAAAMREVSMDFNPSFKTQQWLAHSPIGRREAVQHYEMGLLSAGFP